MLRTVEYNIDYREIPQTWIFEHFCGLDTKLTGQDIKIKSLFNPNEKTPSFVLYFRDGKYRFKDFSSGRSGGAFDLVQQIYGINLAETFNLVKREYVKYLDGYGGYDQFKLEAPVKHILTDYKVRKWNSYDAKYWTAYNISSYILEEYNVKPLDYFVFEKEDKSERYVTQKERTYGYFKNDGTLYKIYTPYREKKFLKICDQIQGLEQVKFNNPTLIICSSLKDVMSFRSLTGKIDLIAPDSENSRIRPEIINYFKQTYNTVLTLFDNDTAGLKSMHSYKESFDIDFVHLEMSKDLSDSVKDFGPDAVKQMLFPLIKKQLK